MRYVKYALIPFVMLSINTAQAMVPGPKAVSLPFTQERLTTPTTAGVVFTYDMSDDLKIVCKIAHPSRVWFEFTDGTPATSSTYTFPTKITFTNLNTSTGLRYHADLTGSITIKSLRGTRSDQSDVSCHYGRDRSNS